MKKIDISWVVVSLMVTVTAYLATNNLYIPIGVFLVYLLYYFVFIRKRIKLFSFRVERIHAGYHFINSFIITLSVKDSLDEAYLNGIRMAPENLIEETNEIENMNTMEKIAFLRSYFNLAIYKMFINIVSLYQEQGGNILAISDSLLRECTRVEKTLAESKSIGNKHLVEFITLWLLSFFILVFLRFAISQFYFQMIGSTLVLGLITGFYCSVIGLKDIHEHAVLW